MYSLDFPKISNPQDIRSELSKVSVANTSYSWINPILETTLDEYVEDYLRNNPPYLNNYQPTLVEEHFAESTRILDRCLSRRTEIFRIEALAITTALDYQFAEQVQIHDLALSLLQVKAYRQQGTAGHSDASSDTVKAKDSLVKSARDTRLRLHSAKGNSLNYGEQIALLRKLYSDDVRSLYERATACRIGLKLSFGISSASLPSWSANTNTLNDLLWWFRDVIKNFEIGRMQEEIIVLHWMLGADGLVAGGVKAVSDELAAAGDADFSFNIGAANVQGDARVLSFSAMPTFSEDLADWTATDARVRANTANLGAASIDLSLWNQGREETRRRRSGFSFPVSIRPPNQKTQIDGTDYVLASDFISIGVRGGWTASNGPLTQTTVLETNNSIINVNPVGEWEIRIPDDVLTPDGKIKRSDLTAAGYLRLQDVVFSLRIAIRK